MKVNRTCEVCSAPFTVYPSELKRSPCRFCSRACRNVSYRGPGNPKWRGGRITTGDGYIHVWVPDHPQADRHGYYEEHRLVMEKHLGRYLLVSECVHHENHQRADNRIENLKVMDWPSHQIEHGDYQPSTCPTCGADVMRSAAHRRRFKNKFCGRKCAANYGSRVAAERVRQ